MDFENNLDFKPQGFPQQGFGQPQQMPSAPGFDQMTAEFQQGSSQAISQPLPDNTFGTPIPVNVPHSAPDGWAQTAEQGSQGTFGGMGPFGANADPFGGNADPFGGNADTFGDAGSFGTPQGSYQDDTMVTQKWWQKGARVILLGGVGVFLLAVVVFIIGTNITKHKAKDTTETTIPKTSTQPVQEQTTQPVQEQTTQPVQEQVTQPETSANGWLVIGNTADYTFVTTKAADFTVQSKGLLYYKQGNGGMQVRSAAVGTITGYDGTYEIDLPRSAVHYSEVIKGYTFSIRFDVYTSADGNTVFLENLRPDR